MSNLNIVETGNKYGNMNTSANFFPENYTREQRVQEFLQNRMNAGKDYGFDGHKVFMADQKDKSGTYFELTQEYALANPNGWSDIDQDILMVSDKNPGIVIGHPVADCPVIVMEDKLQKVVAIAHCSAELIDKKMPMMIADALLKAHGTNEENIRTYVSACAGDSWTYNTYPKWANNTKMWEDAIKLGEDGLYHINLRRIILNQLIERKLQLESIYFNSDDTITNPNYYSNCAASPYGLNDKSKAGRNFAGAFYKEKKLIK